MYVYVYLYIYMYTWDNSKDSHTLFLWDYIFIYGIAPQLGDLRSIWLLKSCKGVLSTSADDPTKTAIWRHIENGGVPSPCSITKGYWFWQYGTTRLPFCINEEIGTWDEKLGADSIYLLLRTNQKPKLASHKLSNLDIMSSLSSMIFPSMLCWCFSLFPIPSLKQPPKWHMGQRGMVMSSPCTSFWRIQQQCTHIVHMYLYNLHTCRLYLYPYKWAMCWMLLSLRSI